VTDGVPGDHWQDVGENDFGYGRTEANLAGPETGLHSGEVELIEEDVVGIAVHVAARVGALAAPGEVLVSSTVKDLVAGSGIRFVDRGAERLRGIPDEWRLFAATP
jgi:class 3 adenylate cyclase